MKKFPTAEYILATPMNEPAHESPWKLVFLCKGSKKEEKTLKGVRALIHKKTREIRKLEETEIDITTDMCKNILSLSKEKAEVYLQ